MPRLIAKTWTMVRKFRLNFSKRIAGRRIYFIGQKKRLEHFQQKWELVLRFENAINQ